MSDFIEKLQVDLDSIRLGEITEAILPLIVRQVGLERLSETVGEAVGMAIDDWNPAGPELSDKALRRTVKGAAVPAVKAVVRKSLEKYERQPDA